MVEDIMVEDGVLDAGMGVDIAHVMGDVHGVVLDVVRWVLEVECALVVVGWVEDALVVVGWVEDALVVVEWVVDALVVG
jgi:hypothetical protein